MAGTFNNIRGTSSPDFQISKGGPTIRQGLGDPSVGPEPGNNGDLFIRRNSRQDLYQMISGVWTQINSLQTVYSRSSSGDITLNGTQNGFRIKDSAAPITGDLFAVTDNVGTDKYFHVNTEGVYAKDENIMDYVKRLDFFMQG